MTGGSQPGTAPVPAPRTAPDAAPHSATRAAPARTGHVPRDADGEADRDGDVIGTAGPPPRRLPRHWTWALTATAATCALWTAALTVRDPAHHGGPDLHGDTLSFSPCGGGALTALLGASPSRSYANPATFSHGPALDRADCTAGTLQGAGSEGASDTALVTVTVELHKQTDPRPEFEDRHRYGLGTLIPADKVTHVPDLGDDAYLLLIEPVRLQLEVVRGGTVVEIALTLEGAPSSPQGAVGDDGSLATVGDLPDLTRYGPRLVTAARAVLSNLAR